MELRTDDGVLISRRNGSSPVRLADKRDGTGAQMLVGYASVFYDARDPMGTQFELYPGCFERISRTAFNRSLSEQDDVVCLWNHLPNELLGRTSSGTCRLSVDDVGLRYSCDICETTTSQDVAILAARMDIVASSFAFAARDVEWTEEAGSQVRIIHDCRLFDVSPVINPAYSATTVAARDLSKQRGELTAEQLRQAKQVEAVTRRLDAEDQSRRAQAAADVEAVMRRISRIHADDVAATLARLART